MAMNLFPMNINLVFARASNWSELPVPWIIIFLRSVYIWCIKARLLFVMLAPIYLNLLIDVAALLDVAGLRIKLIKPAEHSSKFSASGFYYYSFFFTRDQAALRTLLPVHLFVCHTFFTMFLSLYHHAIFRSHYHWQRWCPCRRTREEVKSQGSQRWTNAPIWVFPYRNFSWNSQIATKYGNKLVLA